MGMWQTHNQRTKMSERSEEYQREGEIGLKARSRSMILLVMDRAIKVL